MTWRILSEELDAWAAAGRAATLWWRDDDAVEPSAALERLLGLAAARDVPIALAAIPARASEALARGIETAGARVTLLQHGYAHRNHAPATKKKVATIHVATTFRPRAIRQYLARIDRKLFIWSSGLAGPLRPQA